MRFYFVDSQKLLEDCSEGVPAILVNIPESAPGIHTILSCPLCSITADKKLLKIVPIEIWLNFGNYFRTLQLGILKISFRNCVSALLSTQYRTFHFRGPFDLAKAQSL